MRRARGVRQLPTTFASPQGGSTSIAPRDSTTDFAQLRIPTAHCLTCGPVAPHPPTCYNVTHLYLAHSISAAAPNRDATPYKYKKGRRGTVEPCVLWGPRDLQAHGFESCPRSEYRLGFLTRGNGFLAGGL
ncbi:hypothetical protein E2C01_080925 [Portunus trituberculatus]|uniref:Uncharacterized protein n=1 Tax=Portunus trituberculatus TaxID=210409 RepID=A0A5B7IVA0_PORTR|nr:hypothetical protein [Portunus trituberculatus]